MISLGFISQPFLTSLSQSLLPSPSPSLSATTTALPLPPSRPPPSLSAPPPPSLSATTASPSLPSQLEEEEELRRLRKELVPKAQPMPYFDRPFIPRRSEKQPTIPKEPKFHNHPQHKKIKCCSSISTCNNGLGSYS